MSYVWINGQLVDKSEAKISVFDHGFLYGDGVWEHFRAFNGKLFQPDDPMRYLFHSAGLLGIHIPLSPDEVIAAMEATVRANDRSEGYIRIIVTRGSGTLGPDPRKLDPQVIVIVEEYHPFPAQLYESGLQILNAPMNVDRANPWQGVRVLGRPDLVQAKQHALQNGCLDALLMHSRYPAGCTEGSLFIVSDDRLRTPVGAIHEGMCRTVFELGGYSRGKGFWDSFQIEAVFAADEVFLAGTSCGVIAIVQLNGRTLGNGTEGPITRRIREAYRKLTRGEA